MRRVVWWREPMRLMLGLAVALVALTALPHHYEHGPTPPPAHTCRLCKLQDNVSATPPAPSTALVDADHGRPLVWQPVKAPRTSASPSSSFPRSPPRLV